LTEQQETIDAARTEVEASRQAAAEERQQLQEQRRGVEKHRLDLRLQEEAVKAQQDQLEKMRAELLDQATGESAPAYAAGDAADRRAELAELEASLAAKQAELDQREAALQEAAEQASDGSISNESLAHERAELEGLRTSIDAAQQDIEHRQDDLSRLEESAQHRLAELDEREAELSLRQREITELGEQLDQRQRELDARDAQIAQREQALEEGSPQPDAAPSDDLAERRADLDRRSEALDARAAELEEKLTKYRKALQDSKELIAAERQQVQEREAALEDQESKLAADRERIAERKAKIQEADAYLKERRRKLHRYRKILRQRSMNLQGASADAESSSAQRAGLEKERQMLVEVRNFLESSEAEMVSRWASSKAATIVVGLMLTLCAIAGVSYFAAEELNRPVWQASMVMRIDVPAETGSAWPQQWQEVLTSDSVLKEALHQMRNAGHRWHDSPDSLGAALASQFQVSGTPPMLEMQMTGPQRERLAPTLEALGRALMGHQMAADRVAQRSDTAMLEQPAKVAEQPVVDERWKLMGIIAGSLAGAALVLFVVFRIMLARSKRIFDGDEAPELSVLDKPAAWSPLKAAADEQ
jgi:hypothetical protein